MIHSYPWYISDWRSSETRIKLSPAERCLYRELLDYCWLEGSIPKEETLLAAISAFDLKEFRRCWKAVRPLFVDHEGRLSHRRVIEGRDILQAWHEAKREAGRKGGFAKANAKQTASKHLAQLQQTASKHLANVWPSSSSSSSSSVEDPPAPQRQSADWTSPEDCQPDYWAPKLREAHPKSSSPRLVEQFCVDAQHRLGSPEEFRDFMRKVFNSLVIWADFWNIDGVKYSPKLLDWLDSEGWTKTPEAEEPEGETSTKFIPKPKPVDDGPPLNLAELWPELLK